MVRERSRRLGSPLGRADHKARRHHSAKLEQAVAAITDTVRQDPFDLTEYYRIRLLGPPPRNSRYLFAALMPNALR